MEGQGYVPLTPKIQIVSGKWKIQTGCHLFHSFAQNQIMSNKLQPKQAIRRHLEAQSLKHKPL